MRKKAVRVALGVIAAGVGFLLGTSLILLASTAWGGQAIYPTYPTGEVGFTSGAALHLVCGRFVADHGTTGATKLSANVKTGYGGSELAGFALFPDDDALPPLLGASGVNVTLAGVKVVTGLGPASFTAGITYRACWCATANTGTYYAPHWTPTTGFAALQNAFTASVGRASNDCAAGAVLPASTGMIAADNSVAPPLLVAE